MTSWAGQHWLIVEPIALGHHGVYLEKLVEGAMEHGVSVSLGLSTRDDCVAFGDLLRARYGSDRVKTIVEPLPADCSCFGSPIADVRRERGYLAFFKKVYERSQDGPRVERVFVPYLDYCTNAVGLSGSPFGATPFDAICMRQAFHFKEMGIVGPGGAGEVVKKQLFERLLRLPTLGRMFTIDETLYRYCQARPSEGHAKIGYLPDPAEFVGNETRASARATLGIPDDARVMLLYGAIDGRKGTRSLLGLLRRSDPLSGLHLLVVGRQRAEVEALFADPGLKPYHEAGRIHQINRYVTPEEEQMAFAAADAVWLRYDGFYQMSGVLVKAVQAGLDLELPDSGVLGWYKKVRDSGTPLDFSAHTWENAKRSVFGET